MFPDFPEVKRRTRKLFMQTIRHGVNESEPVMANIPRTTQHEGRAGLIARADQTSDAIDYKKGSGTLNIPVEEMKFTTLEALLEHALGVGRQIAEQQAKAMFDMIEEITNQTGNVFNASVDPKGAFLQMEEQILAEFDPQTQQPIGQMFVIHPSQIEVWQRRFAEWEQDADFVAAREHTRRKKLEEWNARENSRRLAD